MYRPRGLTLIELLIVLAIIGILAVVILAKLNDARDSGIDAKVKAELNILGKRGAVLYNELGNYHRVCGTGGETQTDTIAELITSIESRVDGVVVCNGTVDRFAVSSPLLAAQFWCIDSTGASREISAALAGGTMTCPTN